MGQGILLPDPSDGWQRCAGPQAAGSQHDGVAGALAFLSTPPVQTRQTARPVGSGASHAGHQRPGVGAAPSLTAPPRQRVWAPNLPMSLSHTGP